MAAWARGAGRSEGIGAGRGRGALVARRPSAPWAPLWRHRRRRRRHASRQRPPTHHRQARQPDQVVPAKPQGYRGPARRVPARHCRGRPRTCVRRMRPHVWRVDAPARPLTAARSLPLGSGGETRDRQGSCPAQGARRHL
eukprot:scaffold4006_cov343-Prasinococcus_capsulatus_cf.AAC.1